MAALSIKAKAHRKAQQAEYRRANREAIRAYDKTRSATQKVKDRLKAYRIAHRKEVAAKMRAYKEANKEKLANDQKEYRKANPERHAEDENRRRARKHGADGSHTSSDAKRIRLVQGDKCAYCRARLNGRGHLDHIVAISRGGSNWPKNLQWVCALCNTRKHAKDPIEFAKAMGMLI